MASVSNSTNLKTNAKDDKDIDKDKIEQMYKTINTALKFLISDGYHISVYYRHIDALCRTFLEWSNMDIIKNGDDDIRWGTSHASGFVYDMKSMIYLEDNIKYRCMDDKDWENMSDYIYRVDFKRRNGWDYDSDYEQTNNESSDSDEESDEESDSYYDFDPGSEAKQIRENIDSWKYRKAHESIYNWINKLYEYSKN